MSVERRPGASQKSLLRRFRKSVLDSRVLKIARNKRWFVSKREQRRLQQKTAARKAKRTSALE